MNEPRWLTDLSRKFRNFSIPNIAMVFVIFQVVGYMLIHSDPRWSERLALFPSAVFQGEIWRIVTFIAMPMAESLLGLVFGLMFSYFILNQVECEWGSSKTTLYVMTSLVLTTIFSLLFGYPIVSVTGFAATWFLAAATLFPEQTIQIYMIIPVKLKYLGWIAAAFTAFEFLKGTWFDRFYLLVLYANYGLFFGPALKYRIEQWKRRRDYKNKF